MKTLNDLLALIAAELEANKGKALRYEFDLNTRYGWLSMYEIIELADEPKETTILNNIPIKSDVELQSAYWQIAAKARTHSK